MVSTIRRCSASGARGKIISGTACAEVRDVDSLARDLHEASRVKAIEEVVERVLRLDTLLVRPESDQRVLETGALNLASKHGGPADQLRALPFVEEDIAVILAGTSRTPPA